MASELQQALIDDNLVVVQNKIRLGTYPHAVYAKALAVKALACVQWIACEYPTTLSNWAWSDLAQCKDIDIPADIVRVAHEHGVGVAAKDTWSRSVVAWESRGVAFSSDFYKKLWRLRAMAFKTRDYLVQLGALHRFDAVEAWLDSDVPSQDIERLMKMLWDHAILHCDTPLLEWLTKKTPRAMQMQYLYAGFTTRGLALPSILARRGAVQLWTVDLFLKNGLVGFDNVEHFCQYVGLYDAARLRHVWSRLETSTLIPPHWRSFLASLATCAVHGNEAQRLVVVLRGMYPDNEQQRMQACVESEKAGATIETYLVDLS